MDIQEQQEILREKKLKQKELEKTKRFEDLENKEISFNYKIGKFDENQKIKINNETIHEEKIREDELSKRLDSFKIDDTKKN